MPLRSPSAVEPSSHINRKNAIIAVTKSAYAIFQAPPWAAWPPFLILLMMIGWSFLESPDMLRFLASIEAERAERRAAPKAARIPSGDRPTYSSDEGLHH